MLFNSSGPKTPLSLNASITYLHGGEKAIRERFPLKTLALKTKSKDKKPLTSFGNH